MRGVILRLGPWIDHQRRCDLPRSCPGGRAARASRHSRNPEATQGATSRVRIGRPAECQRRPAPPNPRNAEVRLLAGAPSSSTDVEPGCATGCRAKQPRRRRGRCRHDPQPARCESGGHVDRRPVVSADDRFCCDSDFSLAIASATFRSPETRSGHDACPARGAAQLCIGK